jgi:integrase/recombinase XerC
VNDLWSYLRTRIGCEILALNASSERRSSDMGSATPLPGSARLQLADSVALLRPDEQVFDAMLRGWENQQLARNLATSTVEKRVNAVRAFTAYTNTFPWQWSPQLVDEWLGDLRSVHKLRHSTLRGYQSYVRTFCDYLTDPNYGWATECETRFGTHPVQVVHEWNTAAHVQTGESDPRKRALTLHELETLFDCADDRVARIRTLGRNPHAPEFGGRGVCHVRYGKAMKGSPPKRRSVLTVWPWTVEVLAEWTEEIRPLLARGGNPALWPSERADRVGLQLIDARFAAIRNEAGLDPVLDFHSLRRSYVTHLIEAGWDALFRNRSVTSTPAPPRFLDLHLRLVRLPDPHPARGTRQHARCGRSTHTGISSATTARDTIMTMRRQASYRWRLRKIMAERGMFTTVELVPLLAERGIELSASQVHRLVTGTPVVPGRARRAVRHLRGHRARQPPATSPISPTAGWTAAQPSGPHEPGSYPSNEPAEGLPHTQPREPGAAFAVTARQRHRPHQPRPCDACLTTSSPCRTRPGHRVAGQQSARPRHAARTGAGRDRPHPRCVARAAQPANHRPPPGSADAMRGAAPARPSAPAVRAVGAAPASSGRHR